MTRRDAGFGCLAGGLVSAAIGIGLDTQVEPSAGSPRYLSYLERAIGPLSRFAWEIVGWIGFGALLLALILFVASYWLLGPPRRNA